jgi:hypothetical protein
MWWAIGFISVGHPGPLACWLKGRALNRRKTANADGGPAAEDFEKSLKQLVAEQELAEGAL